MFRVLLKKQLLELLELYFPKKRRRGKQATQPETGKRSTGMVILFAFLYLMIAFGLGAMMWPMCEVFEPMGLSWLYFMMVFLMGVFVGIIGSVFSTYSTLYRAKDNEMLLAMPIRPRTLLLARMVSVFATGAFFIAISCVPAIVVYMIQFGVTFKLVVGCLAGLIALSFIVMALTCFFGWVVALLSGIGRNKSIMTVLVSLALIVVYYVIYFKIQDFIRYMIENAAYVGGQIEDKAYIFKLIGLGFTGHAGGIAIMLLGGAALFALTTLILIKSFTRILTTNRGAKKVVYRQKAVRQASVRSALLRREFIRFFQSPAYMLNGGLGVLLLFGGLVYVLIQFGTVRVFIGQLYHLIDAEMGSDFVWLKRLIDFAPALIVCIIAGMNPISAPSISLEGQNMWLLRSLPATDRDIFLSKQLMQLILVLPLSLAAAAVLTALTGAGAWVYVTNLLTVAGFVFFMTALGLMLGLIKPNLTWTNEAEAVKQGLPVSITLLAGMALPPVMGLLVFLLRKVFDVTPYLWLIPTAGAILVNGWIFKKGGRRLSELS